MCSCIDLTCLFDSKCKFFLIIYSSSLSCRLTRFASESDELVRVLEGGIGDDESSEEEERLRWWWQRRRVRRRGVETPSHEGEPQSRGGNQVDEAMDYEAQPVYEGESSAATNGLVAGVKRPREGSWGGACKAWAADAGKWRHRAQRTAWPHWVYRQFDAYDLARRAAGDSSHPQCWHQHQDVVSTTIVTVIS